MIHYAGVCALHTANNILYNQSYGVNVKTSASECFCGILFSMCVCEYVCVLLIVHSGSR